jgi:hypothetical protein
LVSYIGEFEEAVATITNFIYKVPITHTGVGKNMVILFDRFNLPEDIYEIIFSTNQQKIVAKELIKFMVKRKGEISKTEMSVFATKLHDGQYECILEEAPYKGKKVKLSYNKRQFYDRILTPMKAMGLIDYDLYKKTYKISSKFTADLVRVGQMWKKELARHGISS